MRSYEVARKIFSFMEFCGWSLVVIGGLMAVSMAASVGEYGGVGAAVTAFLIGGSIAAVGLIFVGFVQAGRATVDTAEYTQQMLQIARDQLEVSRRGLKGASDAPQSFAAASSREEPPVSSPYRKAEADTPNESEAEPQAAEIPENATMYNGHMIEQRGNRYFVEGASFLTLGNAKRHVKNLTK
ncbi:hypothetical protein C6W92_06595 [Roseovarius sp. A46]|uniref:hypothetical protein n=1 Tax=Roseovarius sp. A46 TaxID=2109331 RepID=UPI001011328A|nr:hypothetical protein [Roseovarius sp. A46]RXV64719.1 hypothetical protein C6W92_06595 [Roseovarius sp. A46]